MMFVNEFFFSSLLLLFTGSLLIVGTLILMDAFRRLLREWLSEPSREKDRGVVLTIDITRPISNRFGDDPGNLT